MDADKLKAAKGGVLLEMKKMEGGPSSDCDQPARKSTQQEGATSSLGSIFEEILNEREKESATESTSAAIGQVESYLAEATIPRSDEPLHYWRSHANKRPTLAAVAAKFLCAPCTSVDSERLFSAVSHVVDEKRNRLSANMAQTLVFIKKNHHFIKKK